MIQKVLPCPILDHSPVLLEGDSGTHEGPSPFRFENMWLTSEGFKELVKGWWRCLEVRGSNSFIVAEKLKACKPFLKAWNREVFGKVEDNKKDALKRLANLESVENF